MAALYHVQTCTQFARDHLPTVEKCFNGAGYIPFTVHRISGGTRIVFGFFEIVTSIALSILISGFAGSAGLQKEGWKILDFSVHGLVNIFRGFVECHAWLHLICPLYDNFVPENARLSYSRPIFTG